LKALLRTDEELLEQCRRGSEAAFRQLVQRYQQQVRATAVGMLGATGEAEDVAQETFIRLFKSLDRFRGEAQLSTYLTRIAINLSLNALKKRQRQQQRFRIFQGNEPQIQQIEDQGANPEHQDTKELIHKALQELDIDFRSVIVLRLLDGYSVKETADSLQIPPGTVASRLAQAQLKLKVILEKWKAF